MRFRMPSNTSTTELTRERTSRIRCGLLMLVMLLAACRDPNAHTSKIVLETEKAGAGNDISALTSEELRRWFASQPAPFVQKINGECAPLRAKASAEWHLRTAEGRVCDAVAQVAPLMFTPYQADPRKY